MQIFRLPNYPAEKIYIALYMNVKNLSYIRDQFLFQNPNFNYAFIDASTIISLYQVLAAIHNSIRNYKENELKTKNINSEILYSLSPTLTITDAFYKFGITEKTDSLIIVKINGEEEQIKKELEKTINGTELELNDSNIKGISDIVKIRMVKRYFTLNSSNDIKGMQELDKSEIILFPVLSLPLLVEINHAFKDDNTHTKKNSLYYNQIFNFFKTIFQTFQMIPQTPLDLLIRSDRKQKNDTPILISHISWHKAIPIIALSHIKGAIFIYDFRTSSYFKYHLSSPPHVSITCLAFSKQNRLVVGYDNGQLLLWTLDLSIGSVLNKTKAYCKQLVLVKSSYFSEFPCGSISDLAFSQTGRQIFITTSKGAWVYDLIFSEAQRISFSRCFKIALTDCESHCFIAFGTENSIEIFSCLNSGLGLRFSPPLYISTSEIDKLIWASDNRTLFYHTVGSSNISIIYVSPATLVDTPPISRKIPAIISLQFESKSPEPISNFVLNPSSERLVFSFKKRSYLASFQVYLDAVLMTSSLSIASPIGFIFGPDKNKNGDINLIDMQFAPKYAGGALLATIWNDKVTFLPMKFSGKAEIDNFSKANW
ncbi:hypothetical protein PMAC_000671 [Pneumocystis sp. 'macacae']|nr:hypothetical protein PMAC_000671 [Pneumocystis sp. 'macacae']